MSSCATCGAYYRLTPYHKDRINCEDCAYLLPDFQLDAESEEDIRSIVNPSCKTAIVRYDEVDDE